MVGHYYDNIWIYVKSMTDTYDRREDLTEGLSRDLVWTVSNAFGWKQPSGTEITDLHRLLLGQYLSGSFGSEEYKEYSDLSSKEIQQEIWSRVLTSMPYILKTKGTKESIEALVNAYGIPPTILKVREYGGQTIKIINQHKKYNEDLQKHLTLKIVNTLKHNGKKHQVV